VGSSEICINCDADYGQARPKHIADVTSCTIQLSIVFCKDDLIQFHLSYVHSGMETVQLGMCAG